MCHISRPGTFSRRTHGTRLPRRRRKMCAHRPVLLPFLRPGRTLLHVLTSWNGRDIVRADGERRASWFFSE